jgi:hypothetical protein
MVGAKAAITSHSLRRKSATCANKPSLHHTLTYCLAYYTAHSTRSPGKAPEGYRPHVCLQLHLRGEEKTWNDILTQPLASLPNKPLTGTREA